MADLDFKNTKITFPSEPEWIDNSKGSEIGKDKYKPDQSFKDKTGKVVCVIESSSTGDRKVGVGELLSADKFFSDQEVEGTLIFSLCEKSNSSPTPTTQKAYLEPYFKHLRSCGRSHGVKEIHLILEDDFKSIGFEALSDNFNKMAEKLVW